MLSIDVSEQKDVIIITINGDLVFNETDEAEYVFRKQLKKKPRIIGLDCKNLKNLDSSGLGVFIKYSKDAINANIDLLFLNVSESISTLFDASKLENLFEIMPYDEFKDMYL